MKQTRLLPLLMALLLAFGGLSGTAALAATTTAPAQTTIAAKQTTTAPAEEEQPQKKSLGKQMLILLAFACGVGLLAAWYGFTTIRYNQEKMDDMTEESRRIIEKMKKEQEENEKDR